MGGGDTCHSLGSYEGFTQSLPSHMKPFLFGYHISLCYIFGVEDVRGCEFWTHLKMCTQIFDLVAFRLNNGTVNGEMRS